VTVEKAVFEKVFICFWDNLSHFGLHNENNTCLHCLVK